MFDVKNLVKTVFDKKPKRQKLFTVGAAVATLVASGNGNKAGDAPEVPEALKPTLYIAHEYTRAGDEYLVNSEYNANQGYATVAGLAGGGYVITWVTTDEPSGDSDGSAIKAQIYAADGSADGVEFLVNGAASGDQSKPSIIGLSGGGFVISWQTDSGDNIKAQIFAADGSAVGGEFLVNDTATVGVQTEVSITELENGGFVVVWQTDGGFDIKAQIYAADGSQVNGEFFVNDQGIPTEEITPSIAALESGGFVVVWKTDAGDNIKAL